MDVPDESLFDMLERSAARFGPRVALDFYGSTTTYAALLGEVARAAEALRRLGVEKGDRVALVLPNCPQHVVAFYAALRLGAIVVEHNPLYTEEEMAFQLADHRPTVVVAWDKVAPMVRRIVEPLGVRSVLSVNLPSALPTLKRLALRLPVKRATGNLSLRAGQLRLTDVLVDSQNANLTLTGNVDLTDGYLDARLILSGTSEAAGARPDIYMALKGPVSSPVRNIDVSALTGWLTLRAVEVQTKRLRAIEAAQPKVELPPPPPSPPNKDPALPDPAQPEKEMAPALPAPKQLEPAE